MWLLKTQAWCPGAAGERYELSWALCPSNCYFLLTLTAHLHKSNLENLIFMHRSNPPLLSLTSRLNKYLNPSQPNERGLNRAWIVLTIHYEIISFSPERKRKIKKAGRCDSLHTQNSP